MFRIIFSCISQLWDLLCESMSSSTNSTPCTTISQAPSSPVSYSVASTSSQAPSSLMPATTTTTTTTTCPSHSDTMSSATISQTPSSSASTSSPTCWDVFLSFRGEDTRNNFTSYLYDKLVCNGLRIFMDDPELRKGEVISDSLIQAIHESKTYIVVFSENYASSPWCLDELVEILNCHKTAERPVIPVFYKIDPSVVRHQIKSFKGAFGKHHVRFEIEKVNEWRSTLTQVAHLSGFHICENRSEADVINKIVDMIVFEINPKTLDVAKYPVGLDYRVKDITTLLNSGTEGGIRIGLHGMGGVGKTTLAKAVYNENHHHFQGSCFLANVREVSGTNDGLLSLQQKLINDVLKSKSIVIDNVDHGTKVIKDRICSKKVLIVIDDLDKPLRFLEGPFAMGSIIIITTRNEGLLDSIGLEARYKVKELGDVESRQLFTQHAFGNNKISDTFMELSEKVLEHAGGLPLALEVFGSNLLNQSEEGWKWFIDRLKQNPIAGVEEKLVISFEALKFIDPLQDIFLDIACFFIRSKKKKVVKILETCYTHVNYNIDILRKRCLLTINDEDEELGMHDLLRDMGRRIVRNNSPDEPGKHSRLWLSKDIRDVLKKHKGTEVIEGIIPYNIYDEDVVQEDSSSSSCDICHKHVFKGESFTTETFKWMSKLRYLYLSNVKLTGSFEHIFEDLRVFYWDRCPLKCLPSDFCPKKLVILELPSSNMRTMWDLNMVSHDFGKLKTLNMSSSYNLTETPDFTKLPCLETLNLEFCPSLEEVHISIGSLGRLVSLNLLDCKKLRSLPDSICSLRALEVLNISQCSSLEALPIQLGNIESLTKLDARMLPVSELPDSIGHLTKLVELDLSRNMKLKTLPDTICNLRSLEILNIFYCGLDAFPTAIANIESLTKLNASCLTVSKLPDSIGSLTKLVELDVSSNEKLETLPDTICNLRSLEVLNISGCLKLKRLPYQLWKLARLRKLDASLLPRLKKLPDIEPSQIALSLQELRLPFSIYPI